MLPRNVDTVQRTEQERQTFRLWLGGILIISLLFTSVIVFQPTEDRLLQIGLFAFITAIALSVAAFFIREAGSHTTREYENAQRLVIAAGICALIGLGLTIAHYDLLASYYLIVLAFVGVIIIRRPTGPRASS